MAVSIEQTFYKRISIYRKFHKRKTTNFWQDDFPIVFRSFVVRFSSFHLANSSLIFFFLVVTRSRRTLRSFSPLKQFFLLYKPIHFSKKYHVANPGQSKIFKITLNLVRQVYRFIRILIRFLVYKMT